MSCGIYILLGNVVSSQKNHTMWAQLEKRESEAPYYIDWAYQQDAVLAVYVTSPPTICGCEAHTNACIRHIYNIYISC